jgi:cell division protein FtsQ
MKLRRIKKANGPSIKTEKGKKRRRKAVRLVRNLIVTALFTATLIYAALSPFFNIKEISVNASKHYDKAILEEASGISTGQNGFRLLFGGAGRFYLLHIGSAEKQILEKCPYVKSANVRYILPSKVIIGVEERTPAVILRTKTASILADKEGYLLETGADPKKLKLPVIKVPEPKTLNLGKKIDAPGENLISAYELFDTIREMDGVNEDKLITDVDYVDVSDMNNVRFSLQNRITVNLGKLEDLHYKINTTRTIFLKSLKKTDRGVLDFSIDADPVFTPESGG